MDDDVAGVDQHPIAVREALGGDVAAAALLQHLDEALDELERDDVLTEALGPLLASSYIAVKRSEADFFREKSPEAETLQHFYKY